MSHSDSGRRFRWMVAASLVLVALSVTLPVAAFAAPHQYTAGSPKGDGSYEDEVQGAGTAEGDVWGGEQGTTPDDGGFVRTDSYVSTPDAGQAGWQVRLAALFAWMRASLWFSNQE